MDQVTFAAFTNLVAQNFARMQKNPRLYVVSRDGDSLWEDYLGAFPEGTNNLYLVRSHHDCGCCRNFVRNVAGVIAYSENGSIQTIWDMDERYDIEPYATVAKKMAEAVRASAIRTIFLTKESNFGSGVTRAFVRAWKGAELIPTNDVVSWHHFNAPIATTHRRAVPSTELAALESSQGVVLRGLREISLESIKTLNDLINSKNIYRGETISKAVKSFLDLKEKFMGLNNPLEEESFAWRNVETPGARIKNSSAGELLMALSNGDDLEASIKRYEAMVGGANYKRPKALVTPAMVAKAEKDLEELGLIPALQRRHAKIEDISVNDVLFVDNSVLGKLKGGLMAVLGGGQGLVKKAAPDFKTASKLDPENLLELLKTANTVELVLDNSQLGNLMTLTAPVTDTGRIFQWANDFAWSYKGGVADSIKERVKKAGGNVEDAALRISLAWNNNDDLDLSVEQPSGVKVYFGRKEGILDVDMNASGVMNHTDPVENLSFREHQIKDGVYKVYVHCYAKRNSSRPGFTVQVDSWGKVEEFNFSQNIKAAERIELVITVKDKKVVRIQSIDPRLGRGAGRTYNLSEWGIETNTVLPVKVVCNSPNYWGEQATGMKHWFFLLEDCVNPEPVRGFYGEFLNPLLRAHSRVFELLGERMQVPPQQEQLSGVGFTRGRGDEVKLLVNGRPYVLNF